MARPVRNGVDYFPLDVRLDSKFRLIEAEHGIVGFGVTVKLLQEIYSEGYFLICDKHFKILFAKSCGVDIDVFEKILSSCLEYRVFDSEMFKTSSVLTSSGIQKRYFEITKKRSHSSLNKQYLLISVVSDGKN